MAKNLLKWLLIISAFLFADWLIMILIGGVSGLCNASDKFFCTTYCYFGIFLVSVTILLIGYLAYVSLHRKKEHYENQA